jgi:hypothetical protein
MTTGVVFLEDSELVVSLPGLAAINHHA